MCREFAARQGWTVVQEFSDHAISGATLLRSGFQALMRDALNQRFDLVLGEALDRFSRDQEDIAGLFKRLTFAGEERVLVALREKLMRRELFEDFCREYVRELNRLRMEHRAGVSRARSELASADREIRKLVQAIKDGVSALAIKDELLSLEAKNAELQSRLDAPEMPELLHPRMADVYREKVGSLCSGWRARRAALAP